MKCRHCQNPLEHVFLDLGHAPPSNAYLTPIDIYRPETYFPLKLFVCEHCWLVQTEDYAQASELFDENYAYFSSVSKSWLAHAAEYSRNMIARLNLGKDSMVVEVASNDGYLLRNFVLAEIPCLGIEPTASTAQAAERQGIPVMREFFGEAFAVQLTKQGYTADLVLGNNVYAHVPDINDFTSGLKAILKPEGTITLEFPHVMQLLEHTQFDTVYHEHFSYLSLQTVIKIFAKAGLRIYDVEELPTHGGSLRIYGCHQASHHPTSMNVSEVLAKESSHGMAMLDIYRNFQQRADRIKNDLLMFLLEQKRAGKTIAGYGAAAKGNTLLNYAGVKPDLLPYVCDAALSKQNKYLPGSHIPVLAPEAIQERKPDFVLILPWNIKTEVTQQLAFIREWGGQFVVAVPAVTVW